MKTLDAVRMELSELEDERQQMMARMEHTGWTDEKIGLLREILRALEVQLLHEWRPQ
jgi:predicted transcriptional regulator